MISLYELHQENAVKMNDFLFAERTQRTRSLLTAQGILATKRQVCHEHLHNVFSALFVNAYDHGGEFEVTHVSNFYAVKQGLPSNTWGQIQLMTAKGLLKDIGHQQFAITPKLEIAVGELTLEEQINA